MARKKKKTTIHPLKHFKELGFTNRLALYILLFLAAGLAGGFILAWKSITYDFTGALACYTVCMTPIGTATSIVLSKIVNKSIMENTGADGEGIKYAAARAQGFGMNIVSPVDSVEQGHCINSPAI